MGACWSATAIGSDSDMENYISDGSFTFNEKVNPFTLRFRSPKDEVAFRRNLHHMKLIQLRVAMIAGMFLFIGFGHIDSLLFPDAKLWLWILRGLIVVLIGACFYLTFTPVAKRRLDAIITEVVSVGGVGVLGIFILSETSHFTNTVHSAMSLVFIWNFFFSGQRFLPATLTVFILVLAFITTDRFIVHTPHELFVNNLFFLLSTAMGLASASYLMDRLRLLSFLQKRMTDRESRRSERLLLNVLPATIAERMKLGPSTVVDMFPEATIIFADIVDFSAISRDRHPSDVVSILNGVFTAFDSLCEEHKVEKIKTIGDSYMAVAGVPVASADHCKAAAEVALGMMDVIEKQGNRLKLRIGMHSGPVVAGVIGRKKFSYDLWGDTVNIASRMESHGTAGKIQTTAAVRDALRSRYSFTRRGKVEVKGIGKMMTFFLTGKN